MHGAIRPGSNSFGLSIDAHALSLPIDLVDSKRELQGFDSRYLDHGLEDFDLLLRLVLAHSTLAIPTDILNDTPGQSPAFARGFRSYLNLLSLPVFLEGLCTLHRYHKRPLNSPYYKNRTSNQKLFDSNIKEAITQVRANHDPEYRKELLREDGTYDALRVVSQLCAEAAHPPTDPSALFDNVPQHFFHRNRTWRRIKKKARSWMR